MGSRKQTKFFKARECPAQVACDGTYLRDRAICSKCEDAIKRRSAPPKKLRGEPTEYELKKGA